MNLDAFRQNSVKRTYALFEAIKNLCEFEPHPIFLTLSFAENIEDRKLAGQRWDKLRQAIQRYWPNAAFVGVWARQQRGAWHIHLVCTVPLPLLPCKASPKGFRQVALDCGFGVAGINVKYIARSYRGATRKDAMRIARYISDYVSGDNALDPVRDKGVRQMIYGGRLCNHGGVDKGLPVRCVAMRFSWIGGFKHLAGIGRLDRESREGPSGYHWGQPECEAEFLLDVRMGWELISQAWRDKLKWVPRIREWLFREVYRIDDPICPF